MKQGTPASGSSYLAGTVVDVEAIPDTGWQFDSWSGSLTGTTNPTTITMNSNKTITATFSELPPSLGWTAYNDFSGLDPVNVGNIPTGSSGNMTNYATGDAVPVILTVSGGNDGGGSDGALVVDTDAYNIFYGITDPSLDVWWYGTDHSMVFSGLDPNKKYRFVHYADRRKGDNARFSNVIISGVDSFEINSSEGVTIGTTTVTNDTATYCGGDNPQGYVAGFTNIDPGDDGSFTITVGSDDTHEYTTAIMLQELST